MDERIKAHYDALWEMYQKAKKKAKMPLELKKGDWRAGNYDWGYLQGVDDALETFKSMFDLAEYAEGSEG